MVNKAAATEQTEPNAVIIRPLNTKDFWNIVDIFRVGGKEAIAKIKDVEDLNQTEAGMLILDVGLEFAQKELSKFFAEIAEMTPQEYEKAGFDTTLSILEQLEEKENLADFFDRAVKFGKKFFKKK